jgi:FlaA1/EpsC-like NDP-sugar epimerase
MNVIDACIDKGVKRCVALSTDKASSPVNLYGATKLCSDKLFIAGNSYSGKKNTRLSIVRYGNVMGSRGSVIPFFIDQKKTGVLTITDDRMTRFMITLEQGVELVWHTFDDMEGGEIYVKKIPSMKLVDIARAVSESAELKIIGVRPGEKLHEQMIGIEDAPYTYEYKGHFKILPQIHEWAADPYRIKDGISVHENFTYSSDNNTEWMTIEKLKLWMQKHCNKFI